MMMATTTTTTNQISSRMIMLEHKLMLLLQHSMTTMPMYAAQTNQTRTYDRTEQRKKNLAFVLFAFVSTMDSFRVCSNGKLSDRVPVKTLMAFFFSFVFFFQVIVSCCWHDIGTMNERVFSSVFSVRSWCLEANWRKKRSRFGAKHVQWHDR